MNSTVIDTLRFANSLREAGMEPIHAEAISRAINDELTEGVATKRNLDDAVVDLKGEIARLDSRFDTLEAGLAVKFEVLDLKFEALDLKFEALDSKFEAIDSKFEPLDSKFEAIDSKFEPLDSKLDGKKESLSSRLATLSARFGTEARYKFPMLAVIAGIELYRAVLLTIWW